MTGFGALMGAAIASDRAQRRAGYHKASHEVRPVTVERCQTTTERFSEERVEGYRVTYEYQGRAYTLRTREHPGRAGETAGTGVARSGLLSRATVP